MDSYRKMLHKGEGTIEVKKIVKQLDELRNRVKTHALNNTDAVSIMDDGVLLGKIETAIHLLAAEVYKVVS